MGLFSFFGSKSPEEVYSSIAKSIVVSALLYSKELGAENNKHAADAGAEVVYFLLHILDRAAFATLGSEKRSTVFDEVSEIALDDYTKATLSSAPIELQLKIKTHMLQTLDVRQNIYGQCESLAGKLAERGTMVFAFSFYVHRAMELTQRNDVDEILVGNQDVTISDGDTFPDFSTNLHNAAWIGNVIKELEFEKDLKYLK